MVIPKIEISPILIGLIAIIPAIIVYLVLKAKFGLYEHEIKKLESEALVHHSTLLELEQEIVSLQQEKQSIKDENNVVLMSEKKSKSN